MILVTTSSRIIHVLINLHTFIIITLQTVASSAHYFVPIQTLFSQYGHFKSVLRTLPLFTMYVYILLFTNLKDYFIRVYYQQSTDHSIILTVIRKFLNCLFAKTLIISRDFSKIYI